VSCAHVIRMNDAPMLVVVVGPDSTNAVEFVESMMEKVARRHFELCGDMVCWGLRQEEKTYEAYRARVHWNWVTASCEVAP